MTLSSLLVGLVLTAISACEAGPASQAKPVKSREYLERERFLTEVKIEVTALDPGVGALWERLESRAKEATGDELVAVQRDLAHIRSWRTGIEKDFALITDMSHAEWKESAMRMRRGIARLRILLGEPPGRSPAIAAEPRRLVRGEAEQPARP